MNKSDGLVGSDRQGVVVGFVCKGVCISKIAQLNCGMDWYVAHRGIKER
jgi:hypothetical protein